MDDLINSLTASFTAADALIASWHQPTADPSVKSPAGPDRDPAVPRFMMGGSGADQSGSSSGSADVGTSHRTHSPIYTARSPQPAVLLPESTATLTDVGKFNPVDMNLSMSLIDIIVAADAETRYSRAFSDTQLREPTTPDTLMRNSSPVVEHVPRNQSPAQGPRQGGLLSGHDDVSQLGNVATLPMAISRSAIDAKGPLTELASDSDGSSRSRKREPNQLAVSPGIKIGSRSAQGPMTVSTAAAAIASGLTEVVSPVSPVSPGSPNLKPAAKVPHKGWWKTELCKFWGRDDKGGCRNGANCRWAHGNHELRTELPPDTTPPPPQSMKIFDGLPQTSTAHSGMPPSQSPAAAAAAAVQLMSTLAAGLDLTAPATMGVAPISQQRASRGSDAPAVGNQAILISAAAEEAPAWGVSAEAPLDDCLNFTTNAPRWTPQAEDPQTIVVSQLAPLHKFAAKEGTLADSLFGPPIPVPLPGFQHLPAASMPPAFPKANNLSCSEPLIDLHLANMSRMMRAQMLESIWKAMRSGFPSLINADEHVLISTAAGAPPSVIYWLELEGPIMSKEQATCSPPLGCALCGASPSSSPARWRAVSGGNSRTSIAESADFSRPTGSSVGTSATSGSSEAILAPTISASGPFEMLKSVDHQSTSGILPLGVNQDVIGIMCCVDCRFIVKKKAPEVTIALQRLVSQKSIMLGTIQIKKLLRMVEDGLWIDRVACNVRKEKSLVQCHREATARLTLLLSQVWSDSFSREDLQSLAACRFPISELTLNGEAMTTNSSAYSTSLNRRSTDDSALSLLEWLALAEQPLLFAALLNAGILLPARVLAACRWETGNASLVGGASTEDSVLNVPNFDAMDPALTQTWASLL